MGETKAKKRHPSSESAMSNDSVSGYIPTPPDGGWGWVIVFASLTCNIIVDGIGYSFGIFLLEFVDYFGESKSRTSLVGSLLCGVYLCAGPIVSALTNKFGCRPVAVAGSVFAAFSFLISTLSTNVTVLCLTYGVMGGFGFGLIYLPSIVSVGYYFEKKRALATGIAVCGSGIGTFIFAPLTTYLLEEYDWRNALFIVAGIVLNGAVAGMLMRPLEAARHTGKKKRPRTKNMLDRIKEQRKGQRFRSESECSMNMYGIKDNSIIMEGVMEAKLQRENKLQDNDSDLGSLPSSIFIKSLGRQDSRSRQLSLSDKGDYVDASFLSSPSPDPHPQIIVQSSEYTSESNGTGSSRSVPNAVALSTTIKDDHPALTRNGPHSRSQGENNNRRIVNGSPSLPVTPTTEKLPVGKSNSVHEESLYRIVRRSSSKKDHPHAITNGNRQDGGCNSHGGSYHRRTPAETAMLLLEGQYKDHADGSLKRNTLERCHGLRVTEKVPSIPREDYAKPLYRKDIFYSGSVLNIPQFRSQPDMRSYVTSITAIPTAISPDQEAIFWRCLCIPKSAKDTLQEMLDISLLTNVSFIFLCLGNILAFLGFFVPFVYITDRAILLGIPEQRAALLLSVIGITNTVGRIASGFLADLRQVNTLMLNNVALTISGIVTLLAPLCTSYPLLITYCALFGLSISAFISLTSIILCDLLGLEKLTNAFGLLTLARGVAAIAGPPLTGSVFDMTGSYDASFYLGGALIIAGAMCHCVLHLPCFKKINLEMSEEVFATVESIEVATRSTVHESEINAVSSL